MQRLLASSRRENVDLLVIGSSRQGYHSQLIPNGKSVNLWINSAMLGDRLFTYKAFEKSNAIPKSVVVGVDPWMFDPMASRGKIFNAHSLVVFSEEYREVIQEYSEISEDGFHRSWGAPLPADRGGVKNISPKSIKFEIFEQAKLIPFPIDSDPHPVCATLYLDGTFEHSKRTLDHSRDRLDEVWEEAARFGAEYGWYMLKLFPKPDVFLWNLFLGFLLNVKAHTETLIVHIPPFHPAAYCSYELVSKRVNNPLLQTLESGIRNFAQANGVQVVGSFDPGRAGAVAEDFTDSWHFKRDVMPSAFAGFIS